LASTNLNFNPQTDSWAPGEPLPIEQGSTGLGSAEAALAAGGGSDLYQAPQTGNAPATPSGPIAWSPGGTSGVTPLSTPSTVTTAGNNSGGLTDIFGNPAGPAQQGAVQQLGLIGSTIAGITSAVTQPATIPGAINNAVTQGVAAETSAGNWIVRIIVVVVGFIFIAAGLHMFSQQSAVGRQVASAGRSIRRVALPE
jgi:hypothetical protein